jgi:hypothetical protein
LVGFILLIFFHEAPRAFLALAMAFPSSLASAGQKSTLRQKSFMQRRPEFSEGNGKGSKQERKIKSMKNGDTITTVLTFVLVLPWLARLIASAKAAWRALDGRPNKKRNQAV